MSTEKTEIDEITEEDIIGTSESFNFYSMAIEEKIDFIQNMYDVTTVEAEVSKSLVWIAELIIIRIEDKEPHIECLGKGCEKCFGTGKKRAQK